MFQIIKTLKMSSSPNTPRRSNYYLPFFCWAFEIMVLPPVLYHSVGLRQQLKSTIQVNMADCATPCCRVIKDKHIVLILIWSPKADTFVLTM